MMVVLDDFMIRGVQREQKNLVQISLEPIDLGSPHQSVLLIQKEMAVLLMMLGEAPKYTSLWLPYEVR
jgi:hypothetical protein